MCQYDNLGCLCSGLFGGAGPLINPPDESPPASQEIIDNAAGVSQQRASSGGTRQPMASPNQQHTRATASSILPHHPSVIANHAQPTLGTAQAIDMFHNNPEQLIYGSFLDGLVLQSPLDALPSLSLDPAFLLPADVVNFHDAGPASNYQQEVRQREQTTRHQVTPLGQPHAVLFPYHEKGPPPPAFSPSSPPSPSQQHSSMLPADVMSNLQFPLAPKLFALECGRSNQHEWYDYDTDYMSLPTRQIPSSAPWQAPLPVMHAPSFEGTPSFTGQSGNGASSVHPLPFTSGTSELFGTECTMVSIQATATTKSPAAISQTPQATQIKNVARQSIHKRSPDSCVSCQAHQTKCEENPCIRCKVAANHSPTLATRLCYRDNQSVLEARERISDFFECKSRSVSPALTCSSGTRVIKLIHPPQFIGGRAHWSDVPPLTIEVQKCMSSSNMLPLEGMSSYTTAAPASITNKVVSYSEDMIEEIVREEFDVPPVHNEGSDHCDCEVCSSPQLFQSFQIIEQSMPTREDMIGWGKADIVKKAREFPHDIESTLDAMLLRWYESTKRCGSGEVSDPLISIVNHTLGIAILGRFLDGRRPIQHDCFPRNQIAGLDDTMFRASAMPLPVREQLFSLAVGMIQASETKVLYLLDNMVPDYSKSRQSHRQKRFPYQDQVLLIGLCIRRLSLYYRRIALRYKQFNGDTSEQETRRKYAQNMYDMMIRLYCRAFRAELSPFHHLWKKSDHKTVFRDDAELLKLFDHFTVAEATHYQRDVNKEDDIVYEAMFAKKKDKKQKCPADGFEKLRPVPAVSSGTKVSSNTSIATAPALGQESPPIVHRRRSEKTTKTTMKKMAKKHEELKDKVLKNKALKDKASKDKTFKAAYAYAKMRTGSRRNKSNSWQAQNG